MSACSPLHPASPPLFQPRISRFFTTATAATTHASSPKRKAISPVRTVSSTPLYKSVVDRAERVPTGADTIEKDDVVMHEDTLRAKVRKLQRDDKTVRSAKYYWPYEHWELAYRTNKAAYYHDRFMNGVFCAACENLHYRADKPLINDGDLCFTCKQLTPEQRVGLVPRLLALRKPPPPPPKRVLLISADEVRQLGEALRTAAELSLSLRHRAPPRPSQPLFKMQVYSTASRPSTRPPHSR